MFYSRVWLYFVVSLNKQLRQRQKQFEIIEKKKENWEKKNFNFNFSIFFLFFLGLFILLLSAFVSLSLSQFFLSHLKSACRCVCVCVCVCVWIECERKSLYPFRQVTCTQVCQQILARLLLSEVNVPSFYSKPKKDKYRLPSLFAVFSSALIIMIYLNDAYSSKVSFVFVYSSFNDVTDLQ